MFNWPNSCSTTWWRVRYTHLKSQDTKVCVLEFARLGWACGRATHLFRAQSKANLMTLEEVAMIAWTVYRHLTPNLAKWEKEPHTLLVCHTSCSQRSCWGTCSSGVWAGMPLWLGKVSQHQRPLTTIKWIASDSTYFVDIHYVKASTYCRCVEYRLISAISYFLAIKNNIPITLEQIDKFFWTSKTNTYLYAGIGVMWKSANTQPAVHCKCYKAMLKHLPSRCKKAA